MTLYELTGAYLDIQKAVYDPDFDQESAEAALADITDALEDKADNYARIIRQLDADADAIAEEIRRLTARKAMLDNRRDWIKTNLQMAMTATGKTKFKTPFFSFGIQKNPPSVVLDGPEIPEEYLVPQDPKVDKKAIGARLKTGEVLPFAHLEQSESLRIR